MNIVAFYLPQFHTFKENDEWWGEGFTEWTNTKKAVPLFKGHYEPRTPLNDNYYDLTNPQTFDWQIKLAKKYGINGFCFYHYWFSGKILMKKPMEMFLNNKQYNQKYCICWANETWSRRWDGREQDILIKQEHGDEAEWKEHFYYLLPFFKDDRYIRMENRPLFILYKPEIFPNYKDMFNLWDDLAREYDLPGISFGVQSAIWNNDIDMDDSKVDYRILFEPGYTGLRREHSTFFNLSRYFYKALFRILPFCNGAPIIYSAYCRDIVERKVDSEKTIPGMFVNWDNTPRKGKNGSVTLFNSPNKFKKYLSLLIRKTRDEYDKDYIFINAWNEWAEGCYLEPDDKYQYAYLEALRQALVENKEFPELI